jgi:hypothetical protein
MPIAIEERSFPRFVESRHFIATSLGDGRESIVRSGVLLLPNESSDEAAAAGRPWDPVGFRGTSTQAWRRDQVSVELDLAPSINRLRPLSPGPNSYWAFRMDQWAPVASLNSVYDAGASNNAGYAVDAFAVRQPAPDTSVTLELLLAVRDVDAFIFRIGFHVSLTGRLVVENVTGP